MRNEKIIRRAFNAGEVSKRFKHRNDVEKHAYSCEKLENFYVSPLGAISRRKGTQLIGSLGSTDKDDTVRLVPFEYNRDLSYLLVFHSADVQQESWECTSSSFNLPDKFSICYTVPNYTDEFIALEKGNLSIICKTLETSKQITLKVEGQGEISVDVSADDTLVFAYNSSEENKWNIYLNGNFSGITSTLEYIEDGGKITFRAPKKGDMCRLKIIGFDMNHRDATYLPSDYHNQTNDECFAFLKSKEYRVFRSAMHATGEDVHRSLYECVNEAVLPYLNNGTGYFPPKEIPTGIRDVSEFSVIKTGAQFQEEYTLAGKEPPSNFESDLFYVKKEELPPDFDYEKNKYIVFTDEDGTEWVELIYGPSSLSWDKDNNITVKNGVTFDKSLWGSMEAVKYDATNTTTGEEGTMAFDYYQWKQYDENSIDASVSTNASKWEIEFFKKAFQALGLPEEKIENMFTLPSEEFQFYLYEKNNVDTEGYTEDEINRDRYLTLNNTIGTSFNRFNGMNRIDIGITGTPVYDFGTGYIEDFSRWANVGIPLAYDFILIECRIPKGATTFITPEGLRVGGIQESFRKIDDNIQIFGITKNGSDEYTLIDDLSNITSDVEYLIVGVPLCCYNGETKYTNQVKWQYGRNILLDQILKWKNNKIVLLDACDVNGNFICKDIDTQIPVSALHEFQYKQAGAYVYLAHSSFKPTLLKFDGETFIVEDAVKFEPSKTEWESDLVITLDKGYDTGICYSNETITITSNKDFFDISMLDMQLKLEYKDEQAREYKWWHPFSFSLFPINPTGYTTPAFAVCGEIYVRPEGGIWDGVLVLEESTDNGKTWNEIARTTSVEGSSNTEMVREIYDPTSLVRVRMAESRYCTQGEGERIQDYRRGCFFQVIIKGTTAVWGKIVAVESPTKALLKLISPCRSKFTTKYVYRSAWGAGFGYPRTVEIHEERLTLAGTQKNPATVWLSQTNNWDNFRSVSNLETDPLSYNLASDDGEPISWLVSREDLMIGLGSSEWSLGSRDSGEALTQSIVKASNQSSDGVEYIMPAKVGGMVVYVRRGNREIASISYDFANDSYNSISLTTMNPEILGGGAVNIFNQLSPRNNLFVLRKDGILAVFTFDKENNVMAWSRFTFGDGVVSACSLSTGIFRSIFMVVRRNGIMCIERLDANESETDNWLDCVPINSDITIPEGLKTSVNYTSIVKTTPIFTDVIVNVHSLRVYLVDSYGGEYRVVGYNENGDAVEPEFREIQPRENEIFDTSNKPRDYRFSGVVRSGNLEEASIELRTNKPAPFEITAIGADIRG